MTNRVVLITGASRGIGRAMAISYVRAGVSGVVLVARSSKKLDETEASLHAVVEEAGSRRQAELKILKLALDVADSDRKSTRLNSSHSGESRMPSSA